MVEWGINQTEYPVAVRVPSLGIIETGKNIKPDFSSLNKYVVTEKGSEVAVIALGDFYQLGEKVKALLKEKTGIEATLINPRFITGIDKEVLENLKENHKLVITLENGVVDGGFGEKITRFYGNSSMKVLNFGAEKKFTDRLTPEEVYKYNHLTKEQITEDIIALLKEDI